MRLVDAMRKGAEGLEDGEGSRLLSNEEGKRYHESSSLDLPRSDSSLYGDPEVALTLLRWSNIGLPASYMMVGCFEGLSRTFLNVYPLDLGVSEAQQATMSFITVLPATLKILFGFISDNYPLFGLRRKPYMIIGWLLPSFSMWYLLLSSDMSSIETHPINPPSIGLLSLTFLFVGIGMWLADVMGDSIVAEKVRMEPPHKKGNLQSTCYASRFFGIMIATPLSTYCYSVYGPNLVVTIMACAPFVVLPLVYLLFEPRCGSSLGNLPPSSTREQMGVVWDLICQRAVFQPIGVVYAYNLLQIPNAAFRQFLKTTLYFTDANLNELLIISYISLFFGTLLYKRFMLNSSWRLTYQICILVSAILSSLQLLLIRGSTFGLPYFWFALGDDAFAAFVQGIQFLPQTIMMVALCPPGSEGISYALFTTASNSAVLVAPAIGTVLLSIWDVSKEALANGQLDGIFKLTVLCTLLKTLPITFVHLLPRSTAELKNLNMGGGRSAIGGTIFLLVVCSSLAYTIIVGVLNIVNPGWSGES